MSSKPQIVGGFELVREIGSGGMGTVYEARPLGGGDHVALKSVRDTRAAVLQSIRREIESLARIRHPGIVRIVDHGEMQDGSPWYAMELARGQTLREWLHSQTPTSPTRSLRGPEADSTLPQRATPAPAPPQRVHGQGSEALGSLGETLSIMAKLCVPLAYLHGIGVVHRDLKPQNIIVRQSGDPLVFDFGLAIRVGSEISRETLSADPGGVGTVHYMAPEEIRGELVDPRADLYALGCILYEALTGRTPFEAHDSPSHVVWMHVNEAPIPPSHLVPAIPAELDALVLSLLAKQPRDRIGYADDVRTTLVSLGADDRWSVPTPQPRNYLYRPRLTGRRKMMHALEGALAQAMGGSGRLLFLGGPSGSGKTRLAMEVARSAADQATLVLTGECVDRGGLALGALRRPLRTIADRCRQHGAVESARVFGGQVGTLSLYEPTIASLPSLSRSKTPMPAARADAIARVHRALDMVFGRLSVTVPTLLILDDLQWADDLVLGWLERLQHSGLLTDKRILVLGTYRSEEVTPRLAALIGSQDSPPMMLGRLGSPGVEKLSADMLAHTRTPESLARFLRQHSEGNPFFVAEYVRLAVEGGLLYRDAAGTWRVREGDDAEPFEALGLPRSVQTLTIRRLDALSPDARAVLDTAATIGRFCDRTLLEHATELDADAMVDAIGELIRRDMLARASNDHLQFIHDKLREAAQAALETTERSALHRRVATAMETAIGDTRDERVGELARHWDLAGEPERARPLYARAVAISSALHDHGAVERHTRAYLALTTEPSTESIQLRHDLAMGTFYGAGRMEMAEAEIAIALRESAELGDPLTHIRALNDDAAIAWTTGRVSRARETLEHALEVSRVHEGRPNELALLNNLGYVCQIQGRLDEARDLYQRALRIADGESAPQGIIVGNLGMVEQIRGNHEQARELHERSYEFHRAAAQRAYEGYALAHLATTHRELGDLDRAEELYLRAFAIQEETGNRRYHARARYERAELLRRRGALEEAGAEVDSSVELLREIHNRDWLPLALIVAAAVARDRGEPTSELCTEIESLAGELGAGPDSEIGRAFAAFKAT